MKKFYACFQIVFFALFLKAFPLGAEVNFSALDLSDANQLLFRLTVTGVSSREALFVSDVDNKSMRRLTAFPERLELLENGRILQIRNTLGVSRIPVRGGLPEEGFPQGAEAPSSGRIEEIAVSPNGRWILSIRPESYGYGTLVLRDALSGETIDIAAGVERPDQVFPASWSPDSQVFVYARLGRLYYCVANSSVINSFSQVDEKFRLIGAGTINSIVWDQKGDFYYLRGSTVYRVRTAELFTRALYADFLEIGSMAGKIPFEFDPSFDEFWIAPDSGSLLLSKGGRNIFYYPLYTNDFAVVKSGLPYLVLPRSVFQIKILWAAGGGITVLASSREEGSAAVLAWRLDPGAETLAFVPLSPPPGTSASLSPDGRIVLFWGERGISLYDYSTWKFLDLVSSRPGYFCLWTGNNELIAGDEARIEKISLFPGDSVKIIGRELICLSRAAEFCFEAAPRAVPGTSPRILARNNGVWYVTDAKNPWTEIANPQARPASQVSGTYRVYLERQNAGSWANLPMIRNTVSVGTFPLLAVPEYRAEPRSLPPELPGNGVPNGVLNHGSRTGARELSVCFDLYDDVEGLSEVLEALRWFDIKATFFLGGEFIRRYPDAARAIVKAGHEAASLFFASIDLSDSRYQIDRDFISRGLARNEDAYFEATGKELSLLWHPPWYAASSQAREAAAQAGYVTVGRDIDPYDWVSREDEKLFGLPLYSAADMIDRVMNMAGPGSIIPVRLGLLPGGRTDYLFQRLTVLLDALVREGYRMVPVSELVSRAK